MGSLYDTLKAIIKSNILFETAFWILLGILMSILICSAWNFSAEEEESKILRYFFLSFAVIGMLEYFAILIMCN